MIPDQIRKAILLEEESKLPVILGAIFGFLLIVVVVGAFLFRRHLARQNKVSHLGIKRNQPINNTCVQNPGYQGSAVQVAGQPKSDRKGAAQQTQHSAGSLFDLNVTGNYGVNFLH